MTASKVSGDGDDAGADRNLVTDQAVRVTAAVVAPVVVADYLCQLLVPAGASDHPGTGDSMPLDHT